MAFARHNIEKHRLIEMVRLNPILWDCRLPHYKRSDKKKDIKWCELGRTFNVSGERVQRTFTSLREIFRRELNHEKLLGERFTSKWEYYDAMIFLKDVIRERKTRDRFRQELTDMSKEMMDEYAYYTPRPDTHCMNLQPDVIIADSPSPPPLKPSISRSTTPSISIKEEQTDHDGDDEGSTRAHNQATHFQALASQRTFASTPTTTSMAGNKKPKIQSSFCAKTRENNDYDCSSAVLNQTPREILYTKFGEFLSARLNTLNETAANDVMNRILLIIAEN